MSRARDKTLVEQAARAFDAELHTAEYAATHADDVQLNRLLCWLPAERERTFLDLGTGAGYVALELARRYDDVRVIGLDVAGESMRRNAEQASRQGLTRVEFQVYDGFSFPFPDGLFDGVISRFAFHHFPDPGATLSEISRVMNSSARLVLSDAVRHDLDSCDFINRFQRLKRDGHVCMRRRRELVDFLGRYGFALADSFDSSLSFDRDATAEHDKLVAATPEPVLSLYCLERSDARFRLTYGIFNGAFRRQRAAQPGDRRRGGAAA